MFNKVIFSGLFMTLSSLTAKAASPKPIDQRALIAYMEVKPGTEQTYLDLAKVVIAESRREPGNITYQLHESITNPQMFVFYELYASEADLQNHRNSGHVQAFLNATKSITTRFTLKEYAPSVP